MPPPLEGQTTREYGLPKLLLQPVVNTCKTRARLLCMPWFFLSPLKKKGLLVLW